MHFPWTHAPQALPGVVPLEPGLSSTLTRSDCLADFGAHREDGSVQLQVISSRRRSITDHRLEKVNNSDVEAGSVLRTFTKSARSIAMFWSESAPEFAQSARNLAPELRRQAATGRCALLRNASTRCANPMISARSNFHASRRLDHPALSTCRKRGNCSDFFDCIGVRPYSAFRVGKSGSKWVGGAAKGCI